MDSFGGIPEYVLAVPEDESEQLQEEDDTLLSEIQEEDEGVAVKEQKLMLLSLVCCSLVEGATFGNPPGLLQQKLMKVCKNLAEYEPEFILKVALYARQELNIRRALAPMPSCLRTGMADKFRQFGAYQLAKYNTRKSRGKQRHKPKATKSARTTSWDNWKNHRLGRNELFAAKCEALQKTRREMMDSIKKKAVVRDLYPPDLPSFSRSRLPGPWDPTLAGTRMRLPLPQTWDRELSHRGNKAAVWEELIALSPCKITICLLPPRFREAALHGDATKPAQHFEDSVIHSRQLPFRFLSAYKVIVDLERELKKKDEPLPSNLQLIEKVIKQMKLPMNFGKPRYLRGCMEIPLIFQMVKKEKKKLLKSR
ncbi:hypothetical protein Chor_009582 [Crotalus horridus]